LGVFHTGRGEPVKKVSTVRVQGGRCEFDVDYSDEFRGFLDFDAWLKKAGGLYHAAGSGVRVPPDAVAPTQDACARISGGCASIRFLHAKLLARRKDRREHSP